ncbi:Clavaminate synthase-like protein [Suillus brevipes Sb2]|nr:Clavaminate synthase-like protein [Suillus brevipes Sb2]
MALVGLTNTSIAVTIWTPVPRESGLEEIHVVYNDAARRLDASAFSKIEFWHSDMTHEIQPPSTTSLKVMTGPKYGGNTLWSSGAVAQAQESRAAGLNVRRELIETAHPVVRVHLVTGRKSVCVNSGITRRMLGVPEPESDTILDVLFHQLAANVDFHVPFHWDLNSVAFWDNRIVTHTAATFDFRLRTHHALRTTPHGEKPEFVEEERRTGKVAEDRQSEILKEQGIEILQSRKGLSRARGYND